MGIQLAPAWQAAAAAAARNGEFLPRRRPPCSQSGSITPCWFLKLQWQRLPLCSCWRRHPRRRPPQVSALRHHSNSGGASIPASAPIKPISLECLATPRQCIPRLTHASKACACSLLRCRCSTVSCSVLLARCVVVFVLQSGIWPLPDTSHVANVKYVLRFPVEPSTQSVRP